MNTYLRVFYYYLFLIARDKEERVKWVQNLEETIKKHVNSHHLGSAKDVTTEEELNEKLLEAEAYFRILTQQIKVNWLSLIVYSVIYTIKVNCS